MNTRLIFCSKFKNNPSFRRRTKSQMFNFKNKIKLNVVHKTAASAGQSANCFSLHAFSSAAVARNCVSTKIAYLPNRHSSIVAYKLKTIEAENL